MADINKKRLTDLVKKRELAGRMYVPRAYFQGRIDEFCAQNAIGQEDYPKVDLQLGKLSYLDTPARR